MQNANNSQQAKAIFTKFHEAKIKVMFDKYNALSSETLVQTIKGYAMLGAIMSVFNQDEESKELLVHCLVIDAILEARKQLFILKQLERMIDGFFHA